MNIEEIKNQNLTLSDEEISMLKSEYRRSFAFGTRELDDEEIPEEVALEDGSALEEEIQPENPGNETTDKLIFNGFVYPTLLNKESKKLGSSPALT